MFYKLFLSIATLAFFLTAGCSAQQTEEQALQSLREMTRGGKLPPEAAVSNIESRFANKKTGALARLLRARIKFDGGDFAGAASLLDTNMFAERTNLADHALWLRGRALQSVGRHADATVVFSELVTKYPEFVHFDEARIAWADAALNSGRPHEAVQILADPVEKHDPTALLLTAKAHEAAGSRADAVKYYRLTYFYAAGSQPAKDAEAKMIAMLEDLVPKGGEELAARANRLFAARQYTEAASAYTEVASRYPAAAGPDLPIKRLTSMAQSGKMSDAQVLINSLAENERAEGYRQIALGYAKARNWPMARNTVDEFRQKYPESPLVPKTMIDVGTAARNGKYRADDAYYFTGVVIGYPTAIEAAGAQFDMAWAQHESGNFALSSQMLVDHLARYADKDTTNRGKAGYWAARDSERAGKTDDACHLYDAVIYRYAANWYGYIAQQRLAAMKAAGRCGELRRSTASNSPVASAVANLRSVTVAAETSTEKELERVEKSEELSTIGLFDWALDELLEAKKTAANSPKINLALAKHYRLKGDQVNALLSLAKSYPDYAQMFPEEMGREEWDIFYPLTNWSEINRWAKARSLDPYQVAGVIRQETIFDPRASSHANAYGLMQLLLPTAKSMARKYSASTMPSSASDLFDPSLNIELGTAYMKDQFDKFGRFELVGIAYNAGPGRVAPWRSQLPAEMDEFVEAIPFKETKGYVQGIIRNTAQYRRLYDETGNFKPNVGSKPLRGEIDSKPREQFTAEHPEIVVDAKIS